MYHAFASLRRVEFFHSLGAWEPENGGCNRNLAKSPGKVDLLPDRNSDSLAKWLQAHPGVEIISRDRSQEYANGATQGAPDAIQVADRFHLLKNLSDTVLKVLQQEHRLIQQRLSQLGNRDENQPLSEVPPREESDSLTLAEQRRSDRIQQAHEFHQLGWTQKAIARKLNLHPKTVRRYLSGFSPRARRRRMGKSLLDDYKPYLLKRWNEGAHNAAGLYREIRKQGYAGETSMVRLFVKQFRQATSCQSGTPLDPASMVQVPSLRSLTWLIVKRAADRSEEAEQILAQVISDHAKLITTVNLAREFAEMVREQKAGDLDPWLEKAERCGFHSWKNFSSKLRQDYDAVQAALTLPWPNGITEGHVNRLKSIKREMYGRANFDLLRKRVLQLPIVH
jgi:transposase